MMVIVVIERGVFSPRIVTSFGLYKKQFVVRHENTTSPRITGVSTYCCDVIKSIEGRYTLNVHVSQPTIELLV